MKKLNSHLCALNPKISEAEHLCFGADLHEVLAKFLSIRSTSVIYKN